MRKFFLVAAMLTVSTTTISAQSYVSATACKAASAWDAAAGKCVSCKSLVTDTKELKSCSACKAGTAFDIKAGKCVKVTVKKS